MVKNILVLIVIGNLIGFCQLKANDIIDRIGNEIDIHEKIYFNLFPDITNFQNAKISKINDDSIAFNIKYENGKSDTTIFATIHEIENLNKYIQNFERLSDEKFTNELDIETRTLQLKFLSVFLNYALYDDFDITTVDNNTISGRMLLIDDENIVILKGEKYYNFKDLDSIIILNYREINFLNIHAGYFTNGQKNLFLRVKEMIYDRTAFKRVKGKEKYFYPSEISNLLKKKDKEIEEGIYIKQEVDQTYSNSFHCSLYLNSKINIVLDRQVNLIKPDLENAESIPEDFPLNVYGLDLLMINADFSYSLSDRFKVGADIIMYPDIAKRENTITISGGTYGLFLNYSIKPIEPMIFSFFGRSDISATVGLTYNYITVYTNLTEQLSESYYGKIEHEIINQSIGFFAKARFDYYLFRSVSLGMQWDFRYLKPINYPKYEFITDKDYWNTYKKIKYLEKDEINISGTGAWIGITYHF